MGIVILTGCHSNRSVSTNTNSNSQSEVLSKYAGQMKTSAAQLKSEKLYEYIDGWVGVKYKYGGTGKEGVDCSGFVQQVFKNVFQKSLERTATAMVNQCKVIDKSDLSEGDLVFFDISGKNSHVGIYLCNNYFIHASTSKGVILSLLTQEYYVKYWGRAGRVR